MFAFYCLISTILTFELINYLEKYKTTMPFYEYIADLSFHVPGSVACREAIYNWPFYTFYTKEDIDKLYIIE